MIKILAIAFINVTIFTRLANYIIKKIGLRDRTRAYAVFFSVSFYEFVVLSILIKDLRTTLQTLLFYYMPFLVMWLMKDLLEASRKEKEAGVIEEGDDGDIDETGSKEDDDK